MFIFYTQLSINKENRIKILKYQVLLFGIKFLILELINYDFMRIVTFKRIKEFIEKHNDSKTALEEWYFKTTKAKWGNLSDIKRNFNTVDYVGNNRFVFNIKGNNYRLVAIIIFSSQKVYIRFIGTHTEYQRIDCKNI